jgi:hypothetical protein
VYRGTSIFPMVIRLHHEQRAHLVLKTYLQASTGDLKNMIDRAALLLANRHVGHVAPLDNTRGRVPYNTSVSPRTGVITGVTSFLHSENFSSIISISRLSLFLNAQKYSSHRWAYHVIHLDDIHVRWYSINPDPR